MEIDPNISNWILQFLLKQKEINPNTLNSLLNSLPLPKTNPNFQKSLLLHKLQSQLSNNSFSDESINYLEQLDQLNSQLGSNNASNSMKCAYCALILAKTAKHLPGSGKVNDGDKFGFFRDVKRVWRGRIGRLESVVGLEGLGSEELYRWKKDIESAVWDNGVFDKLVDRVREVDVREAVDKYLREEREGMGLCFLELVAEKVKDCSFLDGIDVNGVDEEQVQLKGMLVGCKRSMEPPEPSSTREQLPDSDEMPIGQSLRNKVLNSAEVNRVREALDLSTAELRAVVKDPLPDALRVAEAVAGPTRENSDDFNDRVHEHCAENNVLIVGDDGVVHNAQHNVRDDVPNVSLMERNASARVYEWDESTDESQENVANRYGLRLPNPKVMHVTPLSIYRPKNLKPRRKRRMWSTLEEDTLRSAVQIYGAGNWKDILTAHRDIFEDRTDVDLKDKWRNLTR